MIRVKFTFICMACALFITNAVAAGRDDDSYTLRLWTVEDRLPGSPLTGLTQSRDGYIWLSTSKKLIRFNGVEFASIPFPSAILDVTGPVDGVACGLPDGVWFFGFKGIGCFNDGKWQSWSASDSSSVIGRILGIVISGQGIVRACAERGLLEAVTDEDDRSTRFIAHSCPVPSDDRATLGAVTAADVDSKGRVWMTAWNGLLEYIDGRYDDKSTRLPDFLVEAVSGVHAGRSGRLWINGPNGIAYFDKNIWTPVGFPENAGLAAAMLEVSDGSLWIGNPTGIYRWSENHWTHIDGEGVTAGMSVKQLIEDSDGTVWATCDSGLLRIRRKLVKRIHSDGMVTSGTAYSLYGLADGTVWAGYKGHAVRIAPESGRILQTIYLDVDLPVNAVLQDSKGQIWMGTPGGGLFKSFNGSFPCIVSQRDYSMPVVHTVYSLAEDKKLGVLAGTPQGIMRISESGELESTVVGGISFNETVRNLYHDRNGTLWVCSDTRGVVGFKSDNGIQIYDEKSGLKGYARAVFLDSKGLLWIGTTAGLFCVHNGVLYSVGDKIAGFDQAVVQISEDSFGRKWVGARNGLLSLSFQSFESLVTQADSDYTCGACILKFGVAEGLPGTRALGGVNFCVDFPSSKKSTSKLLFPFEGGICIVAPSRFKLSEEAPKVVIERIFVNGRKLMDNLNGVSQNIIFEPGVRNAVFHFSALSPGSQSSVFYRHRVRGLHEGWSPVQRKRTASFEWLPPGKYTLEVVASKGGLWSETSEKFNFEVKAFFWQMIRFYIALAVVLAGVVFLIARRIVNQRYKMQMEMLQREEALHHERARISRDIHDDLGNGLSVVATLSELAHSDVDKKMVHKRLNQIYDVANELARNVDEIVWAVNPVNDSWEPFISYFEQYTEYFLGNSAMRFHFARPPELKNVKVASKTRHHLLLSVREAIGNILKHACASQVNITMSIVENRLEITVEDDGKGFDTSVSPGVGHNGLTNMRRRMNEINGIFDLKSTPGKGTIMTFSVKL